VPYSSNSDLPAATSQYSDRCKTVFRRVFNDTLSTHGDESRAFATAHTAAKNCQEATKQMENSNAAENRNPEGPHFKIASGAMHPLSPTGDGRKRLRTIASSSIEDLSGDVVSRSALDMMAESAKGKTIFRNHSYKVPDDVFGHVENAYVQQSKTFDNDGKPIWDLVTDIVLAKDEKSEKIYDLVEGGSQLGVSIGARIPKGSAKKNASGGYTFDALKLMEASIVGIPDNPRAFVLNAVKAVKELGLDAEEPEDTNEEFFTASSEPSVTFTTSSPSTTTTVDTSKAKVWVSHDGKGSTVTVDTDGPVDTGAPTENETAASNKKAKKDAEPEVEKAADLEVVAERALDRIDDLLKDLDVDWENLPEGDQAAADALYAEMDALEAGKEEVSFAAEVELTKAPLTGEARSNLSESQFACPAKRKYPIPDKAHIRNALARCGDPSNDQCGCDTVRAAARKAGIGESSKEATPELIKESVVVAETPDETPAQALEQSLPESAGSAADSGEQALLNDTISRSAMALADLVKSQTSELHGLRKQVETVSGERDALKQELHDARVNLKLATEIVKGIAKTPLGRKAVVADKVSQFEDLEARFGGIYSASVLKSLEK